MDHTNVLDRAALEGTFLPASISWAQLEPGIFDVGFGVVNASPLELSYRNFSVGFKAEADVVPQKTMIGIVADPRTQARWFGTPVDARMIAATRTTIDIRSEGAGSFYQATLDRAQLERNFPDAPDAVALSEDLEDVALVADEMHARRLRSFMHRLFSVAREPLAATPFGVPSKAISGSLVPLLASAVERFDQHALEPSKCLNRRLTAVRKCEIYMREHVDSTVTLLELSEHAGMRSRSLINAFEAVTGYSPMDYLKRLRLNGVHRALQAADKTATRIIDVATAWGFWHMGHFASDYRALFGVSPSQTLLS
ncbi:MAG TPA: helix-turn-helix domain-containing protein [Candidatus Nitrosotalea sp.]|nr:helix-turn-helix domain-containing protein [Candidatus Nitrosotalea sp.]